VDREPIQRMLSIDDYHWWFAGRRAVLQAVLPPVRQGRVLDAGCGSGRTLDMLRPWGRLSGIDLDPDAVAAARSRGHDDIRHCPIENLPWPDGTFELITCLDVIEHTHDDLRALTALKRVLTPDGVIIATVPAYEALWSHHDDTHQHRRRYRRSSLSRVARLAGLEVERTTYFNSTLLGPIAAVRLLQRVFHSRPPTHTDYDLTPQILNRFLAQIMRAEAQVVESGHRLPFGVSLLAVLKHADQVNPPAHVPS
jgi:SAM-dependent methyltransferase